MTSANLLVDSCLLTHPAVKQRRFFCFFFGVMFPSAWWIKVLYLLIFSPFWFLHSPWGNISVFSCSWKSTSYFLTLSVMHLVQNCGFLHICWKQSNAVFVLQYKWWSTAVKLQARYLHYVIICRGCLIFSRLITRISFTLHIRLWCIGKTSKAYIMCLLRPPPSLNFSHCLLQARSKQKWCQSQKTWELLVFVVVSMYTFCI